MLTGRLPFGGLPSESRYWAACRPRRIPQPAIRRQSGVAAGATNRRSFVKLKGGQSSHRQKTGHQRILAKAVTSLASCRAANSAAP